MSPARESAGFVETLVSVWRQALVDGAPAVKIGRKSYNVRKTAKRGLRQVDFELDGEALRGLEQNPETQSRWAQMARDGAKIMQFLSGGRYVANVADGKATLYQSSKTSAAAGGRDKKG